MDGELDLLFFSRGRGRGHAIPGMAIVETLRQRRPEMTVRFASYATGAATFREFGCPVVDLHLPEDLHPAGAFPCAVDCIRRWQPRMVVAHEEFGVPAGARLCRSPVLFLTDWFAEPDLFYTEALEDVDEVVFLDEPGIYQQPTSLDGKTHYVGPVLRCFRYGRRDRVRAREELGLAKETTVVSVIVPPGRRIEKVAPLFDLLAPAFAALQAKRKALVWLAGDDHRQLSVRAAGWDDIIVKRDDSPFDRLMVASDLVLTKGNRNVVLELAALGVPSISISHGLNRIDDIRTSQISTNRTLRADQLDSSLLAGCMRDLLAKPVADGLTFHDGAVGAAERLAAFHDRFSQARSRSATADPRSVA